MSYATAASRWAGSLGGDEEGDGRRPGKGTCKVVWHEELAVFEVLQPRGDSLKSMGSTWHGRTMLHAEEGLWLAERGMLTVHPPPTISAEQHIAAAVAARLTPESTRAANTRNEAEEGLIATGQRGERDEVPPTAADTKDVALDPPLSCAPAAPPPTVAKLLPATSNPRGDNGSDHGAAGGGGGGGDGGNGGGGGDGNGGGSGEVAAVAAPVCAGKPSIPQSFSAPSVLERRPPVANNARRPSPDTGKVSAAACESNPTLPGGGPHDMPAEAGAMRGYGVGVGSETGRRRGAKRGRCGAGDGERVALSIGEIFDILPRAGVPWECYRAYAELKRRSYVVRRRMEDTIGHDERAPRAAPLPWLAKKRTLPRAGWAAADNATNRESIAPTPIRTPSSSSSSSSSSPSSSFPSPSVPSSSFPSASSSSPSPSPAPHLPPVTFHVYNPTSAFRKRHPGPPDSVLAVCRFGDPMPAHGALVALADHHARLRQENTWGTPNPDPASQDQGAGGRGTGGEEGKRSGGGSATGGRVLSAAEESGVAAVTEGAAAKGLPMIKLAVVSAEAEVQLFDVCSHDPSIAAGSNRAGVSDK